MHNARPFDGKTIKITHWEKYNLRKDIRNPTWLKLPNTIFSDERFFFLLNEQKLFFFYVLCTSSSKILDRIEVNYDFINRFGPFSDEIITSSITELSNIGWLEVIRNVPVRTKNVTNNITCSRLDKIRLEEKREDNTCSSSSSMNVTPFLERVYSLYPRKQGKLAGMKKLAKTIKTPEDEQRLEKAVSNYSTYCAGTEIQYIKLFSSFVSSWEEWVSPDPAIMASKAPVEEESFARRELRRLEREKQEQLEREKNGIF